MLQVATIVGDAKTLPPYPARVMNICSMVLTVSTAFKLLYSCLSSFGPRRARGCVTSLTDFAFSVGWVLS